MPARPRRAGWANAFAKTSFARPDGDTDTDVLVSDYADSLVEKPAKAANPLPRPAAKGGKGGTSPRSKPEYS